MADKYWIGPAGGLASDDSNWSTTSGGTNDTTAPVSGDVAHFDSGGDTNCTWDIDDSVDIVLESTYTATVTVGSDLTTNGLNSIDIGGGYFYLNGNTVSLNPSASSYIRSGGTLRPTGTLQSSTHGTAIPLYVYGSVDWDYGGSGSEVHLKDVELHLKANIATGGGGVTITFEDSDIYVDLDDSPTGNVTRKLIVSNGDTWINKGTNEIVNNGNSSYEAKLYLYTAGVWDYYDDTQETIFKGGTSTQKGLFIHISGSVTNRNAWNKIHITEHNQGGITFGYNNSMTLLFENDITIDSGANCNFQRYQSPDSSGDTTLIFGTGTKAITITNDGIIKITGSYIKGNGSNVFIFKGHDGAHPVTITGTGTLKKLGVNSSDVIENVNFQMDFTTFNSATLRGFMSLQNVNDINYDVIIETDITAGTLTLDGSSVTSDGNALTIGGISGTGTLTLTNGSLSGADCDFDNVSYTIKGTTLTNCVNVGTNDIWTLLAKDDGTAASNWHFKMPGTKIALTNKISKTKIVGTKL